MTIFSPSVLDPGFRRGDETWVKYTALYPNISVFKINPLQIIFWRLRICITNFMEISQRLKWFQINVTMGRIKEQVANK
jgi:hypothetical protein